VGDIVACKQGLETVTGSQGWWKKFRCRHPKLSLRSAESLAFYCAMSVTTEVVDNYFDLLEETLHQNDLLSKPSLIFNCNESHCIARKGQKHVTAVVSGNKSQITIIACASAAGNTIPPFVIFDWKSLNQELTTGEIPVRCTDLVRGVDGLTPNCSETGLIGTFSSTQQLPILFFSSLMGIPPIINLRLFT